MTRAPENLLAVRRLLLTYLNIDSDTARSQDLEPAEVGIVGDPAHRGGYHCGEDRVVLNDYSVVESPRDRAGLGDDASALDVGQFSYRDALGRTHNLQTFSRWMVAECMSSAPDTMGIREIIYSPDGKTVKRWDRLRKRSTGDSSHLYHTHYSFFRDARGNLTPLFVRYLTYIGAIEGDDMDLTDANLKDIATAVAKGDTTPWAAGDGSATLGGSVSMILGRTGQLGPVAQKVDLIAATLTALAEGLGLSAADIDAIQAAQGAEQAADAARHAELMAAVGNIPPEVIRALGVEQDPVEIAGLLRAALGDRADAVFQAGLNRV